MASSLPRYHDGQILLTISLYLPVRRSKPILWSKITHLLCFPQSRKVFLLWIIWFTSILNLMTLSMISSCFHIQQGAPECCYHYIGVSFSEIQMKTVRRLPRWNCWKPLHVNFWTPNVTILRQSSLRMQQVCSFILSIGLMQIIIVIFGILLQVIHHCSILLQKLYISSALFIRATHFTVMVSSYQWTDGVISGVPFWWVGSDSSSIQ